MIPRLIRGKGGNKSPLRREGTPEYELEKSGAYVCTVDREHRHSHEFKGDDGKDYKLFLPKYLSNNHREKHPNIGTIVSATRGAQFPIGTRIYVNHFTFEDERGEPNIFFEQDGVEYYKVEPRQVMCSIGHHGELIPRKGVVLCEAVVGNPYDTVLDLAGEPRRDVAKVVKVWDGGEDVVKPGEYILLARGGDYVFDHDNKEYLKVDHYNEDFIAVIEKPNWYKKKVERRIRDHTKKA